ncbi:c-type cytochrome [Sphingomonas oligophenolica]|uniref:Cytochrome c family protein n=1 Tax=Sphingomonas oligophenolica TaxID=301154 RepID=A0A502CP95_9SPHN|nr:cytochrome c family protein [Sphingomonas oligophenolica]TPG15465.1 cytochrome c family protein [Sphingomonas oligophenolica]
MDTRTNTIAGWTLAACGAALGLSIVGGMIYHGERPEKMGYPIEGVQEAGAAGAVAEVPIATLLASADPAKGAEVFKKCAACHTINQGGANGVGPNLYATVGEAVAQGKGGYPFSEALKSVGGSWDFDKLNAWLTSPRKFANGTKMTFAGLGNAQDRANVILYLNQQGSNVPLPAAPAAGAPDKSASPAENAVEADPRAATGDLANTGTPAAGAPSVDPNAAKEAAKRGE